MADYNPRVFNAPINSTQFRRAVQRVSNFALSLPEHMIEEGMNWYPAVHEATARQSREHGLSLAQGAGIVAAVSPNMDFERHNINAFDEIGNLTGEHWKMIERSAAQPRIRRSDGSTKAAKRTSEVSAMLGEIAPSLSRATDRNLLDAQRIYQGREDVFDVLNPRTGPKRNRFARNIMNPNDPVPVTIDGRQADIIANRYRPWTWSGRGISSADLPTGKTTRYETHEEVMRRAAGVVRNEHPLMSDINAAGLQAVTWVGGKAHETAWPTKSGQPRVKGVSRRGQRYTDQPHSEWPSMPDARK